MSAPPPLPTRATAKPPVTPPARVPFTGHGRFAHLLGGRAKPLSAPATHKPPDHPPTGLPARVPAVVRDPREDLREDGDSDGRRHTARKLRSPVEDLDPLQRALWFEPARLRPDVPVATISPAASAAQQPPNLDALVDRFLKRIAISGDRHRGTARLSIGDGVLAGSDITLEAEDGRVHLVIDAAPGADLGDYGEKLARRLAARGVRAEVTVR